MPDPLSVALAAADLAAPVLRRHFANLSELRIQTKIRDQQDQGLVTDADLESERMLIDAIAAVFPQHQFLAEESLTTANTDAEHLWIVDPLDGTNNFAHGLPHYAISIAYFRAGQPEIGLIVQPESGDRYWAQRGRGAWHQRHQAEVRRLAVNGQTRLDQALLGVGFYYDRGQMMQQTLATIERLFQQQIHGIRRMGTAALDLALVASGVFGGFFEYQLAPWDVAAGRLLVEEAGGQVTTCRGTPLALRPGSVLASNGHLHPALLEQVAAEIS